MSYKKVFDPIHRFIHLDALESEFLNTTPFQRLHYIHQLGMAFLVYPGGTHRRFEHSLGVMEVATRIYDQVTILDHEHPSTNLKDFLPETASKEHLYWRRVVRMAALCHDLGHLPFSHTAEKRILGDCGHELWTKRIIESAYLEPIWEQLSKEFPNKNVAEDILRIAIGEEKLSEIDPNAKKFTSWEKIVSSIITGDFFGADRIDYLLRDARYTGLAYGDFDYFQLIETLRIFPVESEEEEPRFELGVEANGVESSEALLVSRYFMHKRLCQYPSVKSYGFHLARFMETYFGDYIAKEEVDTYISLTDDIILHKIRQVAEEPKAPGHLDANVLLMRTRRFKALPISNTVPEEMLIRLQEKQGIPEENIGWEYDKEPPLEIGLSFPVLTRDGNIISGKQISEITVPEKPRSWLFVDYQYLDKLEDIYDTTQKMSDQV